MSTCTRGNVSLWCNKLILNWTGFSHILVINWNISTRKLKEFIANELMNENKCHFIILPSHRFQKDLLQLTLSLYQIHLDSYFFENCSLKPALALLGSWAINWLESGAPEACVTFCKPQNRLFQVKLIHIYLNPIKYTP